MAMFSLPLQGEKNTSRKSTTAFSFRPSHLDVPCDSLEEGDNPRDDHQQSPDLSSFKIQAIIRQSTGGVIKRERFFTSARWIILIRCLRI